jgi:hypothetical protein
MHVLTQVNERLGSIDRRLDQIDRRFDYVDGRFNWLLGTVVASWVTMIATQIGTTLAVMYHR